ncbi:uncharacterized protein LOC116295337 [Actinia tenebrosa]|uniref:Uncharacterized protein LOC116295337 n=1 Tax=Actinia tenebrosa TaxID=6105 RepID=A0A6P8I262_ACTTE|nr:uncharacterized protein LOC116295337 [Actinia tenebrosa]
MQIDYVTFKFLTIPLGSLTIVCEQLEAMAGLFHHKRIRWSGVLQILLGLFIVAVGIADRFHLTGYTSGFPARYCLAIWMGIWIFITGVIGLCITLRDTYSPIKKSEVIAYLVFIIISIIFAIALIACYSVSIGFIAYQEGSCKGVGDPATCPVQSSQGMVTVERECDIRIKLAAIILFLSVLEILAALWAIYSCVPKKKHTEPVEPVQLLQEGELSYAHVDLKPRPVSIILLSNQEPAEAPSSNI